MSRAVKQFLKITKSSLLVAGLALTLLSLVAVPVMVVVYQSVQAAAAMGPVAPSSPSPNANNNQLIQIDLSLGTKTPASLKIDKVSRGLGPVKSAADGQYVAEVYSVKQTLISSNKFDVPIPVMEGKSLSQDDSSTPPATTKPARSDVMPTRFSVLTPWFEDAATVKIKQNNSQGAIVTRDIANLAAPAAAPKVAIQSIGGQELLPAKSAAEAKAAATTQTASAAGPANNNGKLDIVIMGQGFPIHSASFQRAVYESQEAIISHDPFKSQANNLNFIMLDLDNKDLGCQFTGVSVAIACDEPTVTTTLTQLGVPVEKVIVLVNTPQDGAAASSIGGTIAVSTISEYTGLNVLHELGHTLGLYDEYVNPDVPPQPMLPNTAQANCWSGPKPTTNPWASLGVPVNLSDIQPGCNGLTTIYRSSPCSLMFSMKCTYFNPVSMQVLVNSIAPFLAADTTSPTGPTMFEPIVHGSSQRIELSWSAAWDDRGVTGYSLYRNGVLFKQLDHTFYDDDEIVDGQTYNYYVQAYDLVGHQSPFSNTVQVTPDITAPSAPSLTITGTSATQVNLRWSKAHDNIGVAGYRLYRNATLIKSGNPYTWMSKSSSDSDLAGKDYYTYSDSGLAPNVVYSYLVVAYDAQGTESNSSPVGALTNDTIAPTAPTNLTGQSATVKNQRLPAYVVRLSWQASSDNFAVSGYQVYRDNVLYQTCAAAGCQDDSVMAGRTYQYKIRAIDAAGNTSAFTPTISVRPGSVAAAF